MNVNDALVGLLIILQNDFVSSLLLLANGLFFSKHDDPINDKLDLYK